ncbi:Intracellular distribution of mitochondria [Globomyces sp. JEL0801]|nr:Intracellular distribution of mitochondria [Globomyces sp. JEL0801]
MTEDVWLWKKRKRDDEEEEEEIAVIKYHKLEFTNETQTVIQCQLSPSCCQLPPFESIPDYEHHYHTCHENGHTKKTGHKSQPTDCMDVDQLTESFTKLLIPRTIMFGRHQQPSKAKRTAHDDEVNEVKETQTEQLRILIKLPNSNSIDLAAVDKTTIQEIKQVINDHSKSQFITCFYISFNGKKLQDSLEVGSIPDFDPPELTVVQDLYTEHEVKIHVNRLREFLTYYKSPVTYYGIDQAASYVSAVSGDSCKSNDAKTVVVNGEQVVKEVSKQFLDGIDENSLKMNKNELDKLIPNNFYKSDIKCVERLLNNASPLFKSAFLELQSDIISRHPFEYLMTSSPAYPWVVKSQPHTADSGRSVEANFIASDVLDTLCARDWNDDLQSAYELPKSTAQERVNRDQAIYRAHSEFLDAAVKGAMAVVNKSIVCLSPAEEDLSQMYIHNGIFFSEGYDNKEQFDPYGGPEASHVAVSKDIDGIRYVNDQNLDGIHTLGTALIDYKGHRIVAQTIVPGILKKSESQESAIKYGSVDGGLEVLNDEEFAESAKTLANALHLETHPVIDQNGAEIQLSTSIDVKWIQGTDSRKYLMDLYRIFPVDALFQEELLGEKDANPYPHHMTFLRQELIDLFYEHKLRLAVQEHQKKNQKPDAEESEVPVNESDLKDFQFSFGLNPDAYTNAKLGGTPEEIDETKKNVMEASGFISVVISQLVLEFVKYGATVPADSKALTALFHRRGLNMRYLGKVTNLFDKITDYPIVLFKELCKEEMISRACKRILRKLLLETPIHLTGACISHFFNCYYGEDGAKVEVNAPASYTFRSLTPSSLHSEIIELVKSRFRYTITGDFWKLRQVTLLRNVCLKVGIQLEGRKYHFNGAVVFKPTDVVNIYPVIKHAQPRAAFAAEAYEHGRMSLAQNQKELGMDLIRESLTIYEQVFGPIHPETGRMYGHLAMVYFQEKDYKQAVLTQRRAVITAERTSGVDDSETIQQYLNIGHMLQKVEAHQKAVVFFKKALELNELILGKDDNSTIMTYEILTKAYFLEGDFRQAMTTQKVVYNYHKKTSGEDSELFKNATQVLQTLTARAVDAAKQEKLRKPSAPVVPEVKSAEVKAPKKKSKGRK